MYFYAQWCIGNSCAEEQGVLNSSRTEQTQKWIVSTQSTLFSTGGTNSNAQIQHYNTKGEEKVKREKPKVNLSKNGAISGKGETTGDKQVR